MPELPEVERGRRIAEAVARGRTIVAVRCARDPIVFQGTGAAAFRRALVGKAVRAARRLGKQLWLELDAPPHPLFHFGMAGAFETPGGTALQLRNGPRAHARWPPRYEKIRLALDDGGELAMTDARRLGRILLRADPEHEPPIARLGFDPLLAMPAPGEFARRLRASSRPLKSLLLDQRFAAGVGNWIADEVLYQARLDPRRRTDALDDAEIRRLRAKLRHVVVTAVAADADDARYPRGWLFHRRWGRRAGTRAWGGHPIEHLVVGGRTTAWVPAVQR